MKRKELAPCLHSDGPGLVSSLAGTPIRTKVYRTLTSNLHLVAHDGKSHFHTHETPGR